MLTTLRRGAGKWNSRSKAAKSHGEVVVHVEPDGPTANDVVRNGQTRLRFSVTDTGIGIPPDRLASLFESFTQVDASTTRIYGGTGLGLAISQRLVDAMGGTLRVESVIGASSTFHFSITLQQAAPITRSSVSGLEHPLHGRSVLIVDDTQTNRHLLRLRLEGWGMTVTEAATTTAAMAIVESGNCFDVGIVDSNMPGTTGQDLAVALRAAPQTSLLPLVLLTRHGDRVLADSSELLDDRLTNQVRVPRLLQHLEEILSPLPPARTATAGSTEPRVALRVLLAEDNAVNQRLGRLMLEKLGHHVDVVGNGQEAIDALRLVPYDLVLMDVEMPEMDGLEATRVIRSTEPAQRQPEIIAMTASAMVEDRQACHDAGMDNYLAKPVRINELEALLDRAADHLNQRRHRPPSTPR